MRQRAVDKIANLHACLFRQAFSYRMQHTPLIFKATVFAIVTPVERILTYYRSLQEPRHAMCLSFV